MPKKSKALARNRGHLDQHRRLILGRSIAAGVTGALPIPILEEWITASIKRSTIKRIANARSVDVEKDAIDIIADGANRPPEWAEIAGGKVLFRLLSRSWRRVLLGLLTVRRLQATGKTFLVSTLFDHYCARLHVGSGVTPTEAIIIRQLIDKAIETTPGGLNRRLFARALASAAKSTIRTPLGIANRLSGGAISKLLTPKDEVHAATEVDAGIDAELNEDQSFLSKAVTAAELELSTEGNPYMRALLDRFDTVWTYRNGKPTPASPPS